MTPLSEDAQAVFDVIETAVEEGAITPSFDAIGQELGLGRRQVERLVNILIRLGHVTATGGKWRVYQIPSLEGHTTKPRTRGGAGLVDVFEDPEETNKRFLKRLLPVARRYREWLIENGGVTV